MRPTQTLNSSGPLLFDGLKAVCWFVNMGSDITSPRIANISPGQLYTFIFFQDAKGNHVMNWPSNVWNAPPIDPAPNSTTVQNFIADIGGILIANVPPTRTP